MVDQEMIYVRNASFNCNHCLAGCFAMNYDSTYSTGKIFEKIPFLRRNNLVTKNIAIVHIYYGQSTFRSQHKEELVGFTDFLCKNFLKYISTFVVKLGKIYIKISIFFIYNTASMGGLLGLFMGFSFISVIELVYFVSIRPYCNYLRFSDRRRELMTKIIRKMDIIRQKKDSSMIITVESRSSLDIDNPHSYID